MKKIDQSNFTVLLGTWKTSGTSRSGDKILTISGVDSYELVLDGNYILHRADVLMGEDRSETLEFIKLENESSEEAIMHYFNSKDEEGSMSSTIINNEFRINGESLKFSGRFNKDNTEMKGQWFSRSANGEWSEFIEIILSKYWR